MSIATTGSKQRRVETHFLAFAHFDVLSRLLWENRAAIDRRSSSRVISLLLASACLTAWTLPERLLAGLWRERGSGMPSPLFVAGYFRSGTTLLHKLLARDSRLAAPTMGQVVTPHGFLTAAILRRLYRRPLGRRYMDNMLIDLSDPQEEEIAMAVLGAPSPYLKMCFRGNSDFYDRFIFLDRITPNERECWARSLRWFLRKLTFFAGGRRLVLKSPYNTARVRHLLKMYPRAQFVHIHRHPFEVVRSQAHNIRRQEVLFNLHRPAPFDDLEAAVAKEYAEVEAAFQHDTALLESGQLAEVSFEALERNPLSEVRRVYDTLGLNFHGEYERRLAATVQSLAGHSKNQLRLLDPETQRRIGPILHPLMQRWGYAEPGVTAGAS